MNEQEEYVTGQEFLERIEEILDEANSLSDEEYSQQGWNYLPYNGHLATSSTGAAGYCIKGVSPKDAEQLRNGLHGSSKIHFALNRRGEFCLLVERDIPFTLAHVEGFDFVGGHKAVYGGR